MTQRSGLHDLVRCASCHLLLALPLVGTPVFAQSNPCDQAGDVPDVITGEIYVIPLSSNINRYGPVGGITAYTFGTYSCNIGTCWLDWCDESPCGNGPELDGPSRHPVISQNLYRLKGGRFEHIGQAWLKHGFRAASLDHCNTDCEITDGDHLGVNCADPYDAATNAL